MKELTIWHKIIATWALLVMLGACSGLGLMPAETFEQRLAYAYGTHTAVLQAATEALTFKEIGADEAKQVLKLADESRTLLDAARSLQGVDPSEAGSKLILATAVLTQLQTYLRSRK